MSRQWLSILEGPDPQTARSIVASDDPELIREVGRALWRRLDPCPGARAGEAPQLVRDEATADGEAP